MTYAQAEAKFKSIKTAIGKWLGIKRVKKQIHDQATKDAFAKSDPDTKMKLIGPQLEIFTSSVSRKSDLLPTIATLVAALIVVTTLNHDLVPLRPTETKAILSLFLILIPITLNYYIKVMEHTARGAVDIIDSYQGFSTFEKMGPVSFLQSLSSEFPIIIVYIIYGVVGLIIFRIWYG
ncbi:MAG: hypothetical protein JWM39_498 [Parcubacteria group bacterium]|nr:hypothetical protein [Parcubacteria group bacterium]